MVLMIVAMVFAVPRGGGPDESAHLVRAAGLVRGQVLGDTSNLGEAYGRFDVPTWVGQPTAACYAFQPEVPASCATVVPAVGFPTSSAKGYPIFGHLLPGLGSLLPGAARTVWWSRLFGAIPSIALLVAAFRCLTRRRAGLGVSAVMFALTPMALFSISVVNPSGLVVAGAVATVVFGTELFAESSRHSSDQWWFVAGFAALVLPRSDGLMWVACLAMALFVAAGRRGVGIVLQRSRIQRAVILAIVVVALGWAVLVPSDLIPVPVTAHGSALLGLVAGRVGTHLQEGIGVLGWLDTPVPVSATMCWLIGVGTFIGLQVVVGSRRRRWVMCWLAAGLVGVPFAIEVLGARSAGLFWQGRYSLPILIALVLAGGLGLDDRLDRAAAHRTARWSSLLGLTVWVLSFLQMTRRFTVGENGTMDIWRWPRGALPIAPLLLCVVFICAGACLRDLVVPRRLDALDATRSVD